MKWQKKSHVALTLAKFRGQEVCLLSIVYQYITEVKSYSFLLVNVVTNFKLQCEKSSRTQKTNKP